MFAELPANMQIYATSAANGKESSWGTYCPPDDKVDGTSLNSCLGDLYSVNWMEDSDASLGAGETLADQFTRVKTLTNKSHVMQFGTLPIAREPTSNFQGKTDKRADEAPPTDARVVRPAARPAGAASSQLPSADAEIASAYARFMASGSVGAAAELISGVQERLLASSRFGRIARAVTGGAVRGVPPEKVPLQCHYEAHRAYVARCGEWTTGALRHSADLAELCVSTRGDSRPIVAAIGEECAAE